MDVGRLLNDAKTNISFALIECANQTPEKALVYISSAEFQIEQAKKEIKKIKTNG